MLLLAVASFVDLRCRVLLHHSLYFTSACPIFCLARCSVVIISVKRFILKVSMFGGSDYYG